LGAKLFGIAALAIAVIGVVPVKLTDVTFDIYVHDTYIVLAARHAALGAALLCGVFAGFYYFGDRGLGLRLNNGMSLGHFLLWVISFVAFVLEADGLSRTIRSNQDPNQSWVLVAGFVAPVLAFIVGGAIFLVNIAWAIVLRLKTV
jgi:heme/copper-type cytochrome/quinol oxidase subunit 1